MNIKRQFGWMGSLILGVVAFAASSSASFAQSSGGGNSEGVSVHEVQSAPSVPMDVVRQGSQYVASYLGDKVEYITVRLHGRSLAGDRYYYLNHDDLVNAGYVNGSFEGLFSALRTLTFDQEVLDLPGEGLDVNLDANFVSLDGSTVLKGNGSVQENEPNANGDRAYLYISIPDYITIPEDNVTNAKWVSQENGYRFEQDLAINYGSGGTRKFTLPTYFLDTGMLLVSSNEKGGETLIGYNLHTRDVLVGHTLQAALQDVYSSAVSLFYSFTDLNNGTQAYQDGNEYYATVPLAEIHLDQAVKEVLDFNLRVWNSDALLAPSTIRVKVKKVFGPRPANLEDEFELQGLKGDAGWKVSLPPGVYQIFRRYPQLAGPGAKG